MYYLGSKLVSRMAASFYQQVLVFKDGSPDTAQETFLGHHFNYMQVILMVWMGWPETQFNFLHKLNNIQNLLHVNIDLKYLLD